LISQTLQPMFGESSPPLPDGLGAHLQTGRDLSVRDALGGQQDDLRALHITISQRQLCRTPFKLTPLVIRESDVGRSRHPNQDSPAGL
jgi:hypothetical protein